ncbi:type II toxin-antitoxin system YafQ family toxin [Bartonella henselae]|nr:type II toxin-antitoxin system YafQ family toxin [Bartonella henselae]
MEPDWLLVYIFDQERVHFDRTDAHSDLFR